MILTLRASFILLVLAVFSACANVPAPQIQSPELTTNTASIVASRDGAYMFVMLDIAEELQENTYALIQYQQLSNPQRYRTLELGAIGESRRLTSKSRPDKIVHTDTAYSVLFRLYSSATYSQVVAQRSILIMPNIPQKIADLMDIQLR